MDTPDMMARPLSEGGQQVDTDDGQGTAGRRRGRGGSGSSASKRHIQTEQRRRDKINEGYMELQKLLGVDNIEKAALLMQAADYTRSLQAAMRQLLELQGQAKLPEDMQWAIRMLLPRPNGTPAPPIPAAAAAAAAGLAGSAAAEPNAGPAAALALLAEHAQQAQAALPGGSMAFQAQAGIAPQQAGGEGDAAAQSQQLQALIAQLQHQQASSQQMQAWQPSGILQALQLSMMQQGGLPQLQQQQLGVTLPGMGHASGEAAAAGEQQHGMPHGVQQDVGQEGGADSGQTADGLT